MNALVLIALRRPYTFVVLSIAIVFFGILSILKTPTDVFPTIRIPVIAVVWTYGGLLPDEFAGRIIYNFEQGVTSTVEGIEHMQSDSYYGRAVVNIFFQPGTEIGSAEADVVAISQTVLITMPEHTPAPMIMKLEASSVPVITLKLTSDNMTPSDLFKLAQIRIRPMLVTVPGAIVPHPYGGMDSFVMISLNQEQLQAHHISAMDVQKVLDTQNVVRPAGDQKIGPTDWMVQTNATPRTVEEIANIPVKRVGNAVVYIHDLGEVYRGGHPQTNLVLVHGKQAVLLVVMKSGEASTLNVINGVRDLLPRLEKVIPASSHISVFSDAAGFVKGAITDVLREMTTAAALTGFVVIMFLGSWRPTVIIATSIPLAILCSLIGLGWLGQTINVMTLGGLALAVGILVDDATVMIENIDTHLEMGKDLETAIVDAANQIVIPTFVSTTCICIVWLPLFALSGVSGWLFMPMAEAIILAMAASFILSRTLVPTMAKYLLAAHGHQGHGAEHGEGHHPHPPKRPGFFTRFQKGFERGFSSFREGYGRFLEGAIRRRRTVVLSMLAFSIASLGLFGIMGRDFFPEVKSGQLQMHMRAPLGSRIEVAGRISALVINRMHELLPGQVADAVANCGMAEAPHNQAFIPTPTIGTQDCDFTIMLNNPESEVWDYRRLLRKELSASFPGTVFTFQPAELTAKILNFGSPSPIDIKIQGPELEKLYQYSRMLVNKIRRIPGSSDVVLQQIMRNPTLFIQNDRTFGSETDITAGDLADSELMTLSGSSTVDPQYWFDPHWGVTFTLNTYIPQPQLTHFNDLLTVPVGGSAKDAHSQIQLLGGVSHVGPVGTPGEVTRYNSMPSFDIYVSTEGVDLGTVLKNVEKIVEENASTLPRGAIVEIQGQAPTMREAYIQLIGGLFVSVAVIYLLIVVNFQSWMDPFIIITALPGALAGIAWSLFLTKTNISVPALTGAIMCMGTATANSILVVSYARERMEIHGKALTAALEAGYGRIRPVIMTASAMIVGMIPMATSNSENAPLGKAVIGGLIMATISTLVFVPCIYAIVYGRRSASKGAA
ncbi:Acriflavin resistance plasma membrane protein [Granulibacter bethesdensis]|uniref:Acriflavin resistance plasma membrane protein n=1 Tax=Granulibacter bethesdensis TaxID=364410 RepID=A0AAN0RC09_9PROT|nr:efflux RND transporter permease subunit [Granulibacter bethesdensis]AHJ61983.1 Acriflavin resistance plasma membrane protein [Granulibacter bethesdensis]